MPPKKRSYAKYRKILHQRQAAFIRWLRKGRCLDCAVYYDALEFDHIRGPKDMNIGHLRKNQRRPPWTRLIEELMKCERVCSSCHKKRTAERGSAWRPPAWQQLQGDAAVPF